MKTFAQTIKGVSPVVGQAAGLSGTGKTAGGGMLAGIAINPALLKLLLLILALPVGAILIGLLLVTHRVETTVQKTSRWIITEIGRALLVIACIAWLGLAGWMTWDRFHERDLIIAAGSPASQSYTLAQALKTSLDDQTPDIRLQVLEVEAAAGNGGLLEKGVVDLAVAPADLPEGAGARRITAPGSSAPQILLARSDVDNRVAYALAQALPPVIAAPAAPPEKAAAPAAPADKAAPQAPAAGKGKPDAKAKSEAPLHPGAAAYYDRDKIPFYRRYARLMALALTGLVLIGLWGWRGRRRKQRQQIRQGINYAPPPGREPWTFARILRESAGKHDRRYSGNPAVL